MTAQDPPMYYLALLEPTDVAPEIVLVDARGVWVFRERAPRPLEGVRLVEALMPEPLQPRDIKRAIARSKSTDRRRKRASRRERK